MKTSVVVSINATRFEALALREELAKNFALIKSLGFDGVELAVRDPGEIDLKKLDFLLKKHELKVPALGTGQAFVEEGLSLTHQEPELRRKARERLVLHLELSAKLGALVIIGLIRGVPRKEEKERALGFLIEELSWLCEKAQSLGSPGLILEPLNRYETSIIHTIGEAKELIDKLGKKNLGILADSFHMNIEEKDIYDSILKAGDLIQHIHLADSNRWAPGQGHLDFDRMFQALEQIRYQGWLSGEYLPEPEPAQAVKVFADFLKGRGKMG